MVSYVVEDVSQIEPLMPVFEDRTVSIVPSGISNSPVSKNKKKPKPPHNSVTIFNRCDNFSRFIQTVHFLCLERFLPNSSIYCSAGQTDLFQDKE